MRVMSENTAMTHPTTRRNEGRAFPFHPAASPSSRSPGVVPRTKVAIATAQRNGSPARMTASSTARVNPHGRRNVSAPIAIGAVFVISSWENRCFRLSGRGIESAQRFGKSSVIDRARRKRTIPVMKERTATNVSENLAAVPRSPRKNPPTAYAEIRQRWKRNWARRLRREIPCPEVDISASAETAITSPPAIAIQVDTPAARPVIRAVRTSPVLPEIPPVGSNVFAISGIAYHTRAATAIPRTVSRTSVSGWSIFFVFSPQESLIGYPRRFAAS